MHPQEKIIYVRTIPELSWREKKYVKDKMLDEMEYRLSKAYDNEENLFGISLAVRELLTFEGMGIIETNRRSNKR